MPFMLSSLTPTTYDWPTTAAAADAVLVDGDTRPRPLAERRPGARSFMRMRCG